MPSSHVLSTPLGLQSTSSVLPASVTPIVASDSLVSSVPSASVSSSVLLPLPVSSASTGPLVRAALSPEESPAQKRSGILRFFTPTTIRPSPPVFQHPASSQFTSVHDPSLANAYAWEKVLPVADHWASQTFVRQGVDAHPEYAIDLADSSFSTSFSSAESVSLDTSTSLHTSRSSSPAPLLQFSSEPFSLSLDVLWADGDVSLASADVPYLVSALGTLSPVHVRHAVLHLISRLLDQEVPRSAAPQAYAAAASILPSLSFLAQLLRCPNRIEDLLIHLALLLDQNGVSCGPDTVYASFHRPPSMSDAAFGSYVKALFYVMINVMAFRRSSYVLCDVCFSDRFVLLEYDAAALSAAPSSPSSLLTSPPLSSPGLSFSSPTFSVASPAIASASSSMSIPAPAEPPFTSDADALAIIYGNSYFGSDSDDDDFANY